MSEILNEFGELIKTNYYIAPFIAFIAGILTSFTPCSLTSIPLVIGCMGGLGANDTKKAFKLSLVFAVRNDNNIYSPWYGGRNFRKVHARRRKNLVYSTWGINDNDVSSNLWSIYIFQRNKLAK